MDLSRNPAQERSRLSRLAAEAPSEFANDFKQLLRVFDERRKVITVVTAAVTLLVVLVAFQIPPRYTGTAQVLIDPRQNKILDLETVFAGITPEAAQVDSQVQVIRSQALLERLVDQQDLTQDPEFNNKLRDQPGILGVVENAVGWIPAALKGLFSPRKAGAYVTREDDLARLRSEVAQEVGDRLQVKRNAATLVIDIKFASASPTKAAKLANALAELYVVDQLEAKFDETRRATDWLNEKLSLLREDLRSSEEAVEAFKAAHNLLGSAEGLTLDSQQLAEVHKNLILARTAREEAEVRLQQIREIYDSGGGISRVANVVTSDLLTTLREQDAVLMQEQANLSTRYQARHPKMIEVQSQRNNLAAKIREEVNRIIQELENNVRVAKAREQALEQSLTQQTVRSEGENKLSIQLRELELEAESNRRIYEAFLGRFKSLSDQEGIQESDARLISRATVPRAPSFPNKRVVVGGGLVFSLLLGLAVALFLDRLDAGIRTANQLESLTSLRNLAVIPLLQETSPAPHEYVLRKPLSAFSESIRGLHNSLFLSSPKEPLRAVVVTSSLPDEGKSTLSLSLARLAARAGKRTILVDGDLRRPSIYALIPGPASERTIIDVIEGRATLDQAVIRDPDSGLNVLLARDGGDQSPDLVNSAGMAELVKSLQALYDLIIIDSPPVLPVGDTLILSRMADTVIYVVRWQTTPRDAVTNGLNLLNDAGANVLGTALSQVDFERYTRYSYGDVGSHYRRYQGYYVQ
jgi:capsular exopolysaccharide synthesis family protein